MWNSTTERLQQLHDNIQKTVTASLNERRSSPPSAASTSEVTPAPPSAFRDVPGASADFATRSSTIKPHPDVRSVPIPEFQGNTHLQTRKSVPVIVIEDTSFDVAERPVDLDVLAIEQSVLAPSAHAEEDTLLDDSLIPAEFRRESCAADPSQEDKSGVRTDSYQDTAAEDITRVTDTKSAVTPALSSGALLVSSECQTGSGVCLSNTPPDAHVPQVTDIEKQREVEKCTVSTKSEQKSETSENGQDYWDFNVPPSLVEGNKSQGEIHHVADKRVKSEQESATPDILTSEFWDFNTSADSLVKDNEEGLSAKLDVQEPQSSAESTPQAPSRRKKSIKRAPSEASPHVTPQTSSASSSPLVSLRSRSLKKKYPAPKPPIRNSGENTADNKVASQKQLQFDDESQREAEELKKDCALRRTASLPVKTRTVEINVNAESKIRDHISDDSVESVTSILERDSVPPVPPPRLKKKLRLSQSLHRAKPPDFLREPVARSTSLPQNDSTYENFEFKSRGIAVIPEEPQNPAVPAAEGDISIIQINGNTHDVIVENPVQDREVSLDDAIPDNPESVSAADDKVPEQFYVNVIQVAGNSDPTEIATENNPDDMDAKARKQELENLRSQFFGKKSNASSLQEEESSLPSANLSSKVVSVSGYIEPQIVDPDPTSAQFVTITDVRRSPSPDPSSTSSLYNIVRSKRDSTNNNEDTQYPDHVQVEARSSSKIILDLDEHQTKRELDPVLDFSSIPAPSKIAFALDDQVQQEFVPQKHKTQSRVVLDLDDFSSRPELDSGFSSNNNTLSSAPPDLLDSCQRSKMILDLDDIQMVSGTETKSLDNSNLLVDIGSPNEFQNESLMYGSVTDPETSELSTPDAPCSPYSGWNRLEDSDVSDDEQNFSATFTPGAPVPQDFAGNQKEDYEDSGIVLVSYQQKAKDPDFLDLTMQVPQSDPVSTSGNSNQVVDPFDPFDPFSVPSLGGTSTTRDSTDLYTDALAIVAGTHSPLEDINIPEPPIGFDNNSNPDTENKPLTFSSNLDKNVYNDNTVDLGGSSLGESTTDTIEQDYWATQIDSTATRVIGHVHDNQRSIMDSQTSGLDPHHEPVKSASKDVAVSKSFILWDNQTADVVEDERPKSREDSRPESAASRESLHLDLNQTPEKGESPIPESDMDPNTGLRRTTPLSPLEKAIRFVENTELTYVVRKKDIPGEENEPLSPEQAAISLELEHERNEIMGAMRVRKKRLDSWVQDSIEAGNNKYKSESERKYEQRKKKFDMEKEKEELDFGTVPAPHWSALIVKTNHADDERFGKQELVESWNNKNVGPEPYSSKPSTDVGDLRKYSDKDTDNNNIYQNESAIDREVRLVREREEELQREKQERSQVDDMPIHKIPDLAPMDKRSPKSAVISPTLPASPPPVTSMYKELPEVDRDSAILKRESIIEREIREQQDREKALKEDGYLRFSQQQNKEAEQSEFERQEKEHERVLAHESIVAREIREQQEREQEIISLRQSMSSTPTSLPDYDLASAAMASSQPASATVTVTTTRLIEPEPEQHVNHTVAITTTKVTREVTREGTHVEPEAVITYEEALKTKSHEGESLIARELREQREREDEYRTYCKQRGLGNFLADQEHSDTPYNRPEPAQPDLTKLSARAKSTIKPMGKMTKSISEPVQISAPRNVKHDIVTQPAKVTSSVSQDTISASSKPDPVPEESMPAEQSPRDEADGFDHSYRFTSQNETPIEREMRLVKEREEELRQVRGIPKAAKDPDDIVEIKDYSVPASKPHVNYKKGDEGDGKFLQKLASGRLQIEIEREKRRELDLKSQGMINTLSEERVSGPKKYVDVIPREPAKTTPNWKLQSQTSVSSIQRTASPGGASTASSYDALDNISDSGVSVTVNTTNNGGQAVIQSQGKAEPSITQRYSTQAKTEHVVVRVRPTPNMAESRIEQELREMRAREEELRNLHRAFSEFVDSSNGKAGSASPNQPANGYEAYSRSQSTPSADSVKAARRKSALAEEWEKKFGAN